MFEKLKLDRAYKRVFGSEDGKLVLADLLKYSKMFDTTYNGSDTQMAMHEGRRQTALRILGHIKLSPEDAFDHVRRLHERTSERADGRE